MLHFADDVAIIANNEKYLEQLLKTMDKTFIEILNTTINVQKQKLNVTRVKLSSWIRHITIQML